MTFLDKISSTDAEDNQYITRCQTWIESLCRELQLPGSVETAAKDLIEEIPVRIRQHYRPTHMAAAALHLETRRTDESCPRTIKQLATELEDQLEAKTHLSSEGNHLKKTRRAAKKLKNHFDFDLTPELPKEYLPYILDQLDLDESIRDRAWTMIEEVDGRPELQSKSKIGIASAITYIAAEHESEEDISLTRLRELSCRKEKTIRETTHLIEDLLADTGESCGD